MLHIADPHTHYEILMKSRAKKARQITRKILLNLRNQMEKAKISERDILKFYGSSENIVKNIFQRGVSKTVKRAATRHIIITK